MGTKKPLKDTVLLAIGNKGTARVRKEAKLIADEHSVKKESVLRWVRKIEKGEIKLLWPLDMAPGAELSIDPRRSSGQYCVFSTRMV